jgi:hypothetical protein
MSALEIENAHYESMITALDESCVIFLTGKFVPKHVIQLRVRNKDRPKFSFY